MLVIRLQRTGRENLPTYRLVVAEKARPVKGKYLEIVGHYLPARDPAVLEKKDDRIKHWVAQGAIPSDTVARILKRSGLDGMEKFIQPYAKRKSKEAAARATAPAAAANNVPASTETAAGTLKAETQPQPIDATAAMEPEKKGETNTEDATAA